MELRYMHPKTIENTITYQFKIFIVRNSVNCSCAILSLHSFQKLAVFRSPHITAHTHNQTYNEFSEFELILSPFNGPHYIVQQEVYIACNVCAMRCDAMMMMIK